MHLLFMVSSMVLHKTAVEATARYEVNDVVFLIL